MTICKFVGVDMVRQRFLSQLSSLKVCGHGSAGSERSDVVCQRLLGEAGEVIRSVAVLIRN